MKSLRANSLIAHLLAFVTVGVVMNVGAAWSLAWGYRNYTFPSSLARAEIIRPMYRGENDGWRFLWPGGWSPRATFRRYEALCLGCDIVCYIDDGNERRFPTPTPKTFTYLSATQLLFGLPLPAMGFWEQNGALVPTSAVVMAKSIGPLPLVPLWPGFALNTLFYAALAWGLWQVPLAIRRRRRRAKRMCVRCGYDREGIAAGTVCPECGEGAIAR